MNSKRYVLTEDGENLFKTFQSTHLQKSNNDSPTTAEFKANFNQVIALLLELNTSELLNSIKRKSNNLKVEPSAAILAASALTNPSISLKANNTMNEVSKYISQETPLVVTPHDQEQLDIAKSYYDKVLLRFNSTHIPGTAGNAFPKYIEKTFLNAKTEQLALIQRELNAAREAARLEAMTELKLADKATVIFSSDDTHISALGKINLAYPEELTQLHSHEAFKQFITNCRNIESSSPIAYFTELETLVSMELLNCQNRLNRPSNPQEEADPNFSEVTFYRALKTLQNSISEVITSITNETRSGKTSPADDASVRSISSAHSSTMFNTGSPAPTSRSHSQESIGDRADSSATDTEEHPAPR